MTQNPEAPTWEDLDEPAVELLAMLQGGPVAALLPAETTQLTAAGYATKLAEGWALTDAGVAAADLLFGGGA